MRRPAGDCEAISRRRMLAMGAGAALLPLLQPQPIAHASNGRDLHFHTLWHGSSVGLHRVTFRTEGDLLRVDTQVDIVARFLFFTLFRLKHDAREVWRSGRLLSITSATERDGVRLEVYGEAVEHGFRIVGKNGPFLAAAHLLTTNSLWDSRIVQETRLINAQYGGEVGLVTRLLGQEEVSTPQGPVRASRYQMITPQYAGSVFYDSDERWVKALIESKGETIEYALAI